MTSNANRDREHESAAPLTIITRVGSGWHSSPTAAGIPADIKPTPVTALDDDKSLE